MPTTVPEMLPAVAEMLAVPPERTVPLKLCAALTVEFCRETIKPRTLPWAAIFIVPPTTPPAPRSMLPVKPGDPPEGGVPAVKVIVGPPAMFPFSANC